MVIYKKQNLTDSQEVSGSNPLFYTTPARKRIVYGLSFLWPLQA